MAVINFGKYSGKNISEIPEDYLKWGAQNLSNKEWQTLFKNELFVRSAKLVMKTHEHALAKLSDKTYDPLIFGKDSTEYITNVSFKDDKIYKYLSSGTCLVEEYKPWYLNINKHGTKLNGSQFYNYINHSPYDQYNALSLSWDKTKWFPRTVEEGYMVLNGVTLFKGMKTDQVSLHSFDIETTTADPRLANAKVVLISNTVRKNGKTTRKLFDIQSYDLDEQKMIQDWCVFVKDMNCDILLGHNVFGFDLPYLGRYSLPIGRDGGDAVEFEEKVSKFRKDGTQSYEYNNVKIHGRSVIDTFFLSMKYDISRYFPSYGLKVIEKHLKLVDDTRIEWDFEKHPPSEIYKEPSELWEKFKEYCNQDSDSPIKLFDIMAPSFFYMNQSVPKTFQQMNNEATGSQLDSIMIRSYLQNGESIPRSSPKVEFEGAVSMGLPGVYENARKIDVVSMYPSIMLEYKIYDKQKDPKAYLLKLLQYFKDERINAKNKFKETGYKYWDDLQNSFKILINSLFGYLGAGYLLFNYPEGAAEVTRRGREIIRKTILWSTGYTIKKDIKKTRNKGKDNEENEYHWVLDEKVEEGKGYQLINCDTDSITYTSGIKPSKDEFKNEIIEINGLLPPTIIFEDDGVFDKVIVSKAKNYIMKKGDELKVKGSSFKSSNKEPILKDMNTDIINEMLGSNNIEQIKAIYNTYVIKAENITDINVWATKKTYTDTMQESERANETKVIDAINQGIDSGALKSIQQGDKIYLYQTVNGMKQKMKKGEPQFYKKTGEPMLEPNKILKLTALYNNDADAEHYVERVNDTLRILENILPVEEIIKNGT